MRFSSILFLLVVAFTAESTNTPVSSTAAKVAGVMMPGEELLYEVSWTFFKLGKIRVITLPSPNPDSGVVYSAVAYSDSYDLPFVNFHAFSTSEMDSTLFSKGSTLFEKRDTSWFRQIYHFFPMSRLYVTENSYVREIKSPPLFPSIFDTMKLSYDTFQDGTSILYYARAHVNDHRAVAVPTLVRGKAGKTNFYFPAERTTETIDAVDYAIRVLEMDGKVEFEGIFGLTGDFAGWFSDDEAAVPIRAKMKVILGSITLELLEWKRPGWSPPRAD